MTTQPNEREGASNSPSLSDTTIRELEAQLRTAQRELEEVRQTLENCHTVAESRKAELSDLRAKLKRYEEKLNNRKTAEEGLLMLVEEREEAKKVLTHAEAKYALYAYEDDHFLQSEGKDK